MKLLLTYLKKRISRIESMAIDLSKICREQGVHELRVELKKLRAAFRLLKAADPEFEYRRAFKPYRGLFISAGQVREIQLQKARVKSEDLPADFKTCYLNKLNAQYRSARAVFRDYVHMTRFPKWKNHLSFLEQSAQKCDRGRLAVYFDSLKGQIARYLRPGGIRQVEDLHSLRKLLKDYNANRQIAQKHFRFDPGQPEGLTAEIDKMMEDLGNWHDGEVALRRLQQDMLHGRWQASDLQAAHRLFSLWQAQTKALYHQLHLPDQTDAEA